MSSWIFGAATLGLLLAATAEAAYTVTGTITCDNSVLMFTADSEAAGMQLHQADVHACWPGTQAVNVTSSDRFLYLACWSDDTVAQGLLHDFTISSPLGQLQAFSGSPLWKVAPGDDNLSVCSLPSDVIAENVLAQRIPTAQFADVAVGCANPPPGQDCYGRWGPVPAISGSARWMWFDSHLQTSPNAPFQPGFNHRELLIFRLDLLPLLPVSARNQSWGALKAIYR